MSDKNAEGMPYIVDDEPRPHWRGSPWVSAIESLFFGDTKRMAELLERGEHIPPELGKVLATALRGGDGLPFRLQLISNPKPGGKRPGRWPERNAIRNITLAAQMYKKMQSGLTYDNAALAVTGEARPAVGERTIKAAYEKYKDIAPAWLSGLETEGDYIKKSIAEPEKTEPLAPPIASWMLNGDS